MNGTRNVRGGWNPPRYPVPHAAQGNDGSRAAERALAA